MAVLPDESREVFQNEFNAEAMAAKLEAMPGKIRNQRTVVADAMQNMQDRKTELDNLEGMLALEISQEKNPKTGKPMFSNEKTRSAELVRRKTEDPEYQAALQVYKQEEAAYNAAQFDLEMLRDEFSAIRAAAEFWGNYMRLLAS